MRITVEIRDDQRARLLELAAGGGENGYSRIIEEALDQFFALEQRRDERVQRGLAAVGSRDEASAQRLEESARRIRDTWR